MKLLDRINNKIKYYIWPDLLVYKTLSDSRPSLTNLPSDPIEAKQLFKDVEAHHKRLDKALETIKYNSCSNRVNLWFWGMFWFNTGTSSISLYNSFSVAMIFSTFINAMLLLNCAQHMINNKKKRDEVFVDAI